MSEAELKAHARACGLGCLDHERKPVMVTPSEGFTHGPGFSKVPALIWQHGERHDEPHWRREVPKQKLGIKEG